MPFFDKDKVKLELAVNNLVIPGGFISGQLNVLVMEEVKCVGIQLRVQGVEECLSHIPDNPIAWKTTRKFCEKFVYFDVTVDLMNNPSKSSVDFQKGTFSFPVNIPIPPNAPPSYAAYIGKGCVSLEYSASVQFDIPNGYDAEATFPITVLSCIPRGVYDRRRAEPVTTDTKSCAVMKGCCGGGSGGLINVTAEIFQSVLVLRSSGSYNVQQPPPPPAYSPDMIFPIDKVPPTKNPSKPSELAVRVHVDNQDSATDLRLIKVELLQTSSIKSASVDVQGVRTLACVDYIPPSGRVGPNEKLSFEVLLSVPQTIATAISDAPSGFPIPTLATSVTTSRVALSVSFPTADVDKSLVVEDLVLLSSALDLSDSVPADMSYRHGVRK